MPLMLCTFRRMSLRVSSTLMDTPKSKDSLKARKDMVQLNVMPELHPVLEDNGKYTLPATSYNLDLQERRAYTLL
jgi:hypothetical protein